jgi:hypothetical protein
MLPPGRGAESATVVDLELPVQVERETPMTVSSTSGSGAATFLAGGGEMGALMRATDFARRLASIRVRHERKGQFIERLIALGLFSGDR